MTAEPGHVNDDLIRRFVLNTATPEECDLIGRRLVEDPDFIDEIGGMQDELILAHLNGRLPAEWREAFQAAFLNPVEGQRIVEEDAALRRALAAAATSAVAASPGRRANPLRTRAVTALACAAVLVLAVTAMLIYRGRSQPGTSGPSGAAAPRPADAAPAPTAIATFILVPGTTRAAGGGNALRVPAGIAEMQLRVVLPSPPFTTARFSIAPVGGRPLMIASTPEARFEADAIHLTWSVPASLLPPDDYLLSASVATAGGETEPLITTFFSVVD